MSDLQQKSTFDFNSFEFQDVRYGTLHYITLNYIQYVHVIKFVNVRELFPERTVPYVL